MLNHLYDQRETFCILVKAIPTKDFTGHLFDIPIIGKIFQNMVDASSYSESKARYIRQFVFQGTFAVLCDWLGSENPEPVSEIAGVLGLLKSKL